MVVGRELPAPPVQHHQAVFRVEQAHAGRHADGVAIDGLVMVAEVTTRVPHRAASKLRCPVSAVGRVFTMLRGGGCACPGMAPRRWFKWRSKEYSRAWCLSEVKLRSAAEKILARAVAGGGWWYRDLEPGEPEVPA